MSVAIDSLDQFIGSTADMQTVKALIEIVATTDVPVLIEGETGTGKTTVAHLIHYCSSRSRRPIVTVAPAAYPVGMILPELFGHEKGAYSAAIVNRTGLIAEAEGGMLLLDGVEDLPLVVQAGVLRMLEDKAYRPLGSFRDFAIDIRVVATAEPGLRQLISDGRFRVDFYFKLSAIPIILPPLRKRLPDIPLIAEAILRSLSAEEIRLTPAAIDRLQRHDFPGNLSELRAILIRALATLKGRIVDEHDLVITPTVAPSVETPRLLQAELDQTRSELQSLQNTTIVASPIWEGRSFPLESDLCFVLMPFGEEQDLQTVYRDHIAAVVKRTGFRTVRADDIYDISGVMQSVWEGINRARFIIADVTNSNPNVFYELGIAHTLGKPVIMLTQSMDYVPFDLRHRRCIVYDFKPKAIERFERALEKTVRTVISST